MRTDRTMQHLRSASRGAAASAWRLGIALALAIVASEGPAAAQGTATRDLVVTGDHVVETGEVVGDVAVVGGTLTVRGRVTGEAVVVGGDLILPSSGEIQGNATVTGGSIVQEGGRILGEMKVLDGDAPGRAAAVERDLETRAERSEERTEAASSRAERRSRGSSWFDPIRRGFADLFSTLAFGLVLAIVGGALVFFARAHLETVSDTLRASTARSAAVGLAAGFLIIPAFVVMVVALAVSIVGIPALILAIPLYPLAIVAGAAMGLLAGAHAIGERTAEQQGRPFDRPWGNSYAYLFAGLALLLAPLALASIIQMTGFLDFLGDLLKFVTWAVIWIVTTAGFGAVILSRAGTRRTFAAPPSSFTVDPDSLLDEEPSGRSPFP
jgi:cytoskeletal protein CcmA (bactofilin family)